MKRVALARGATPLRRTPLKRSTAAPRAAYERPGSGGKTAGRGKDIPRDVRAIVAGRSKGQCEARIDGCLGAATNMHHRQRRAGGIHTAANLMHLCGSGTTGCHGWITEHPALSRAAGWIVSFAGDPACEPVRYRCKRLVWLLEDGRLVGERGAS